MRLKLIHEGRPSSGGESCTSVVNAETGEPIRGVVGVFFLRPCIDHDGLLTITVLDFDAEIEAEGQVVPYLRPAPPEPGIERGPKEKWPPLRPQGE